MQALSISSVSAPGSVLTAMTSFWRRGDRVERLGYLIGAVLLSSGAIHLAILLAPARLDHELALVREIRTSARFVPTFVATGSASRAPPRT